MATEPSAGMPRLVVEVNFASPSSDALVFDDATRGLFDTGTLAAADEWVDVTGFVRSGRITRGSTRFEGVIARYEAGTAEVLLSNADARFDPTNLDGPYVTAGESQVRPMRAWRIRADGFDLWRGFADGWDPSYPMSGKDAVCLLRGTDAVTVLANDDRPPLGSAVGAGENTGARIARILDNATWPAADRDLDVGLTACQATDLGQPAWAEAVLTAETEVGELYVDGAGKVVFRNRHALLTDARSVNPQAVFGDAPGELGYADLSIAFDADQLANLVRIGRAGSAVEAVRQDVPSQDRYLVRTFSRTDLIHTTDAESGYLADYVLALLKDPDLRFDSVVILPQGDPDVLFPQALGRELGDRLTIRLRPPGREADPIERDVFVRGIAHEFTPATWSTTWTLQDATGRFNFLIFDHATLGRLDENRLAY
jgi:hypothetical protein